MLITFLSAVLLIVCAVLVFFILGQDVKGGGLAGAFGGGSVQSAFGSKSSETVLKITGYLTVAVFLLVIVLSVMHGQWTGGEGVTAEEDTRSAPVTSQTPPVETPAP